MKHFWHSSESAARFVEGLMEHSKPDSPLTTIITREKSGDYSVQIVTIELSEDIDEKALNFYKPYVDILKDHTQDG